MNTKEIIAYFDHLDVKTYCGPDTLADDMWEMLSDDEALAGRRADWDDCEKAADTLWENQSYVSQPPKYRTVNAPDHGPEAELTDARSKGIGAFDAAHDSYTAQQLLGRIPAEAEYVSKRTKTLELELEKSQEYDRSTGHLIKLLDGLSHYDLCRLEELITLKRNQEI